MAGTPSFASDLQAISDVIDVYFSGLHHADTATLSSVFDEDCHLCAPGVRLSLAQWLAKVESRPVPAELGLPYLYRIVSMGVYGNQAMVQAICPLLGSEYFDFLGLLREHSQWKIVSKMYADSSL
ncbi:nuclear transport factor 2 family protein [Gilvimarinus sp. SDUM040013]|uniref:Nuclear transport factor 2 family protein n=1 Tax=Gilvimarinus gilvus TaxID=3058038 RepID=A0ABU4S118_9GAMM|nr:nuclear transport factor 2 family protein [Gilvimarinus sp. SDUM040013]MDO3384797.1 nuclear transport factor 2 family protein [Gilvimarinus sp. SDUM040013]MDX6850870.1 nuclear transport factor 2 family protein [Gilvimarinus sp. SDUM040013]